jgi:hypothetical protein
MGKFVVLVFSNIEIIRNTLKINRERFFFGDQCYWGFTITLRHTTICWNPLDEWSVRCRDLYLRQHTKLTTDRLPWLRHDSHPQSQQANGRKPTPGRRDQLQNHTLITIFLSVTYWLFERVSDNIDMYILMYGYANYEVITAVLIRNHQVFLNRILCRSVILIDLSEEFIASIFKVAALNENLMGLFLTA